MDVQTIIDEVQQIIEAQLPDGFEIFLFGSQAKGTATDTSDIDIGILGETLVPFEKMVRILSAVEAIPTLRKIDVIDLNSVDELFKSSALANSKLLTLTRKHD
jgi:predicted nucleotidyltransferase